MTKPKPESPEFLPAGPLIRRCTELIEQLGFESVVIGGQAVIQHGYVRTTQDVDFTVFGTPSDGLAFIDALESLGYHSRQPDPAGFLRATMVLPYQDPATGLGIDLSFVNSEYIRAVIDRASRHEIEGKEIAFLSVEDLVIHKVLAQRDRDKIDCVELLSKYPNLDAEMIDHWLGQFEQVVETPLISVFQAWRAEALG